MELWVQLSIVMDWKVVMNIIISLNPDSVEKIHKAYIEAGADIIQTNTYCC